MKTRRFRLVLLLLALTPLAVAQGDAEKTRSLLGVVESDAALAERAHALQQLALVATPDAVPALARLLADEHLGQYARDALEQLPDARAGEALRAALGSLQGRALIGAVNSLGVRREAAAVEALGRLVANPSTGAAGPALIALGRIGGAVGLRIVEPMLRSAAPELRAAAAEACLVHANRLLDGGEHGPALMLFQKVRATDVPAPLRLTATRGAILADERGGRALLFESLRSADADLRDVALLALRDLPDPAVTSALLAEIDRLALPVQTLVIEALAERTGAGVLPAIEARATATDAVVRQARSARAGKNRRRVERAHSDRGAERRADHRAQKPIAHNCAGN